MLEAPKKPAMPLVLLKTAAASSGSAIGPPWQSNRTSGFTATAASCMAWTRATASSSVRAVLAPMLPLVVSPMWATTTSAPALAICSASSTSNT